MKWILWFIVILIVIFGGWYLLSQPGSSNQQTSTATTTQTTDIINGISNATYTSSRLSFSIEYPSNASSTTDFSSGYLPLTQTPVVAFELPQSMFSGTNLGEAGVYIGATTTPAAMTTCEQAGQEETATSSETINGSVFSVFTSTGVGAGNIYQEKAFRTIQNGQCLEIVELLHSGNIDNYPSGTVQPFNYAEFSDILDSIVNTYQAIPTGV